MSTIDAVILKRAPEYARQQDESRELWRSRLVAALGFWARHLDWCLSEAVVATRTEEQLIEARTHVSVLKQYLDRPGAKTCAECEQRSAVSYGLCLRCSEALAGL